ncbi:MAG: hypothetical protein HND46_23760 [Chloroflexi bacterium]|nr:hypothetical protein [Chloroflexota bacterium]NOG66438.1 hypothetical protein [Chloroflexota bacterium]GIK42232.1 MAG: hypothetical protein BroJett011_60650 [Chloroflexota bacterium]
MEHKIKIFKRLLCSLFLAAAVLTGLLVIIELAFPSHAAAHNLTSNYPVSGYQDPLFTFASPHVDFIQATSVATLYLPIIYKNPKLLYSDDFSDNGSDWPVGDDGVCSSKYDSGRFRLDVDKGEFCFRFAPIDTDNPAARTYGYFEVAAYHSDGPSNSAFGIYINGEGGDNQYIFKIRPNNSCGSGGGWELVRNREGTKTSLGSGCHTSIKRGYGSANINLLRINHTSDRKLTLFVNNVQIFVFQESTNRELLGKGTGVYAEAANDGDNIKVFKYDNFKVFAPNAQLN